jgi:hypothetical protein
VRARLAFHGITDLKVSVLPNCNLVRRRPNAGQMAVAYAKVQLLLIPVAARPVLHKDRHNNKSKREKSCEVKKRFDLVGKLRQAQYDASHSVYRESKGKQQKEDVPRLAPEPQKK